MVNVGCLLGVNYCQSIIHIPTQDEVSKTTSIEKYQQLAFHAEKPVPKMWWREAFANDKLMLSKNYTDWPRKLINLHVQRNKNWKN